MFQASTCFQIFKTHQISYLAILILFPNLSESFIIFYGRFLELDTLMMHNVLTFTDNFLELFANYKFSILIQVILSYISNMTSDPALSNFLLLHSFVKDQNQSPFFLKPPHNVLLSFQIRIQWVPLAEQSFFEKLFNH